MVFCHTIRSIYEPRLNPINRHIRSIINILMSLCSTWIAVGRRIFTETGHFSGFQGTKIQNHLRSPLTFPLSPCYLPFGSADSINWKFSTFEYDFLSNLPHCNLEEITSPVMMKSVTPNSTKMILN